MKFDKQTIINALTSYHPQPADKSASLPDALPSDWQPWINKEIGPATVPAPIPYHFSEKLKEVIAIAIVMGKPLLIQGEPGCGKTQLALAVAHALELPLETFYVKSNSKGQDLLYTYDALARLYDAQIASTEAAANARAKEISSYLKLGPLGKAIARSNPQYNQSDGERPDSKRRSVVLIDEIDKADSDFPNDLLLELDALEFYIPEANRLRIAADKSNAPIIFITNNKERALPDAFLRRCIFYHLDFPDADTLEKIFATHQIDPQVHPLAIKTINFLREQQLSKNPGLSEIIDWLTYHQGTELAVLNSLPNTELLLKTEEDARRSTKIKDAFNPPPATEQS